jgi:hypothetical protein
LYSIRVCTRCEGGTEQQDYHALLAAQLSNIDGGGRALGEARS